VDQQVFFSWIRILKLSQKDFGGFGSRAGQASIELRNWVAGTIGEYLFTRE
jgi:hypothetical protein